MATKALKEGIFLRKNSKGFFITIKQNQHKIATLGGYNSKQNATKGLLALFKMLKAWAYAEDDSEIIDLTKKATKKK